MAGTNEILPFAINVAANVMSQEDYEAENMGSGFVVLGFQAGVANSAYLNKVWRQSSFVASGIAQFIADQGFDALDNGSVNDLVSNFEDALLGLTRNTPTYSEDTGAANAYEGTVSPTPATLPQDFTVDIKIGSGNTNTGAATLNLNAIGAKAITLNGNALQGGELVEDQIYTFKLDIDSNSWQVTSNVVEAASVFTGSAPTTGTANAQVLATVTPSGFNLRYGNIVNFTAGVTNTNATTLNVASSGIKTVKKSSGGALVDLAAGNLNNGDAYQVYWNGTDWVMVDPGVDPSLYLQKANNLSDLTNTVTARANLGLGTAAVRNVGTTGADVIPTFDCVGIWIGAQAFPDGTTVPNQTTGTNNTKAANTAFVQQELAPLAADIAALPFTTSFVSADLPATTGAVQTVAHGLGGVPELVIGELVCQTAELGYAVGDRVTLASWIYMSSQNYGSTVSYNTTTVSVTIGSSGYYISSKNGSAKGLITPANWKIVIRAWK